MPDGAAADDDRVIVGHIDGFERQITIRLPDDVAESEYDSLRQIDVTIFYRVRNAERQLTLSAYIANYRQVN